MLCMIKRNLIRIEHLTKLNWWTQSNHCSTFDWFDLCTIMIFILFFYFFFHYLYIATCVLFWMNMKILYKVVKRSRAQYTIIALIHYTTEDTMTCVLFVCWFVFNSNISVRKRRDRHSANELLIIFCIELDSIFLRSDFMNDALSI